MDRVKNGALSVIWKLLQHTPNLGLSLAPSFHDPQRITQSSMSWLGIHQGSLGLAQTAQDLDVLGPDNTAPSIMQTIFPAPWLAIDTRGHSRYVDRAREHAPGLLRDLPTNALETTNSRPSTPRMYSPLDR